jgi:hypothetical protein
MGVFRKSEPTNPPAGPKLAPASVKIGRSPIRVNVQPPATSPNAARRKALTEAVRRTTTGFAHTRG